MGWVKDIADNLSQKQLITIVILGLLLAAIAYTGVKVYEINSKERIEMARIAGGRK